MEVKFHDLTADNATLGSGGEILNTLLAIDEGTGESERIGRQISLVSVAWRWDVFLKESTDSATTTDVVRFGIALDTQANGTAPAFTDLFEEDHYQSFPNKANATRFTVLYDKYLPMSCAAGSGRGLTDTLSYAEYRRTGYVEVPLEGLVVDYSATGGGIADLSTVNIVCFAASNSGLCHFLSKIRVSYVG